MVNTVELVNHYGSDETHALSAWTSTNRELTTEKRNRIPQLLKKLAQEGHHTPFEKSCLHFLCVTDIATHIQLLKHRVGVSVNAESARYKELTEDKFYVPTDWPAIEQERLTLFLENAMFQYHATVQRLEASGLTRKRAKESARFYLPYATQIRCDVMFNFRSFMHFQGLRNKPDAQKEIQNLAADMLALVPNSFKMSLEAFGIDKGNKTHDHKTNT